jgi:hypothetical protein
LAKASTFVQAIKDLFSLPASFTHAAGMGPGKGFARDLVQSTPEKEIGLFVARIPQLSLWDPPTGFVPNAGEMTIG